MKSPAPSAVLLGLGLVLAFAGRADPAQTPTPDVQTYKGLELFVAGLERAPSAALSDCPAGANTQRAIAKPGEGFAIVTLHVKVLPKYAPVRLMRPVLIDSAGTVYYTAASFLEVGTVPEFSCAFSFRIADNATPKSFQVEDVEFDLTGR